MGRIHFSVGGESNLLHKGTQFVYSWGSRDGTVVRTLASHQCNHVVFNLNYFFVTLMLGPTSTCAVNTAEGKQRLFIIIYLFVTRVRFPDSASYVG